MIMNKVYIRWNPLHEKVVCVHTNDEKSCPSCDKAMDDIKGTGYFLKGSWFEVDSKSLNNETDEHTT